MAQVTDDRFQGATPLPERQWFDLHAPLLCLIANHPEGRALLGIDPGLPPVVGVLPHALTCDLGGGRHLGEFRTRNVWGAAVRRRWADFRRFAQSLYKIEVAGRSVYRPVLRLAGELVAAATTTTFHPDAGDPGTTTCAGRMAVQSVDESFAAIRAEAGNFGQTASSFVPTILVASGTANQYTDLYRGHAGFDTSSLTAAVTVGAATLSLYYPSGFSTDTLGSQTVAVVSSSPASNTTLVASDFANFGATDYATRKTILAITTNVFTDFALNAAGIAHVSKTGVSNFGVRLGCDVDGAAPTWSSGNSASANAYTEDGGGAGVGPKLAVTYAVATPSGGLTLLGVG